MADVEVQSGSWDIVRELIWVGHPLMVAAADEIERLRAAGDNLVAAIRNHDLQEAHLKAWEGRTDD